jgi:fructose-1-phosphate kinase PfkB-like protein
MNNLSLKKAMDNAEASINMEGLYVSDSSKELCEKLLKKEITIDEYIKIITTGAWAYGV